MSDDVDCCVTNCAACDGCAVGDEERIDGIFAA